MTPEEWTKVGTLFDAALSVDVATRDEWLKNNCSDDKLRAEVERLLQDDARAEKEDFLPLSAQSLEVKPAAAEPAPVPTASTGAKRKIGDYEVIREIARGGMGIVYAARDPKLERKVAIKMILPGALTDADSIERFQREALAHAKLNHPNIVAIFETGKHEGNCFNVMPLVSGDSLDKVVDRGPLLPKRAADLVRRIADAVEYAHSKGVVHRDLKPSNVLIDKAGQPRVTDFGLARQLDQDSNLTGQGRILGTPGYMPPEQASGAASASGPSVDIYSMGAILYCLLTGRQPFQGATLADTLRLVREHPVVPPRQLNPAIPVELETITLKCLRKLPAERYATAADLAADLRAWLKGEPITAAPIKKKWPDRFREHRAAIPAVVGVVIAIATLVTYLALATRAARRDAALARDALATAAVESSEFKAKLGLPDAAAREQFRAWSLLDAFHPQRAKVQQSLIDLCTRNGRLIAPPLHHRAAVLATCISPDGQRVATACADGSVRLWDAITGMPRTVELKHPAAVSCLAFLPEGTQLLTGCADGCLRQWERTSGQSVGAALDTGSPILTLAITPSGKIATTIGDDGQVQFWDLAKGVRLGGTTARAKEPETKLRVCPGGERVLVIQPDQPATIIPTNNGTESRTLGENVIAAGWSADGSSVITVNEHAVTRWQTATGMVVGMPIEIPARVLAAEVSDDGEHVALSMAEGSLLTYEVATGRRLWTAPVSVRISTMQFNRDGSLLAAAAGKSVRVHSMTDGRTVGEPLNHDAPVRSMGFGPEGRKIVTSCDDGSGRVWIAEKPIPRTAGTTTDQLRAAFSLWTDSAPEALGRMHTLSEEELARIRIQLNSNDPLLPRTPTSSPF